MVGLTASPLIATSPSATSIERMPTISWRGTSITPSRAGSAR